MIPNREEIPMGIVIIVALFALAIALSALSYLSTRFRRFVWLERLAKFDKKRTKLFSYLAVLVLILPAFFRFLPTAVVILHLVVFWALSDLIGLLVQKWRKRIFLRYYQGAVAIVITAVYMLCAWVSSCYVHQTDYHLQTDKDIGSLRIVLLADSHLGDIMSGEDFADEMQKVQATNPDIVVIAGDFVDDDTSKKELDIACQALSRLKTTYGVYYVFGNHDKGFFASRDFSEDYLRQQLAENHVTILEDETVLLNDSIYLIGRQDRSTRRASISELTAGLDPSKYTIVLNHQPNDYEAEAECMVDLVLSGHTHGGHIFPLGIVGYVFGANDQVYGLEQRGQTQFIVSSGISGWGIPFKTGAISEFVVIDIS